MSLPRDPTFNDWLKWECKVFPFCPHVDYSDLNSRAPCGQPSLSWTLNYNLAFPVPDLSFFPSLPQLMITRACSFYQTSCTKLCLRLFPREPCLNPIGWSYLKYKTRTGPFLIGPKLAITHLPNVKKNSQRSPWDSDMWTRESSW